MMNRDADKTVRDIRRATRRKFSAEEKIRIVLEGLRGEETIAELTVESDPKLHKMASELPYCRLRHSNSEVTSIDGVPSNDCRSTFGLMQKLVGLIVKSMATGTIL